MPIYYVNLDVQYKRPLDLISTKHRRRAKAVAAFLQEFGATYGDVAELKQVIEGIVLED